VPGFIISRINLEEEKVELSIPSDTILNSNLIGKIKRLKRLATSMLGLQEEVLEGIRIYYANGVIELRFSGDRVAILAVGSSIGKGITSASVDINEKQKSTGVEMPVF